MAGTSARRRGKHTGQRSRALQPTSSVHVHAHVHSPAVGVGALLAPHVQGEVVNEAALEREAARWKGSGHMGKQARWVRCSPGAAGLARNKPQACGRQGARGVAGQPASWQRSLCEVNQAAGGSPQAVVAAAVTDALVAPAARHPHRGQ